MAKIEYNKLKEYCEYFLEDFKKDEKLKVKIRVDRPDAMTLIATITSKTFKRELVCPYMEIKFDDEAIAVYSDFFPDERINEFGNIWNESSEKEICEILNNLKLKFKHNINNGYVLVAYKDNDVEKVTTFYHTNKNKFNFKNIYNEAKWKIDSNFEDLTKIEVYDFHSNLLDTYTAPSSEKE